MPTIGRTPRLYRNPGGRSDNRRATQISPFGPGTSIPQTQTTRRQNSNVSLYGDGGSVADKPLNPVSTPVSPRFNDAAPQPALYSMNPKASAVPSTASPGYAGMVQAPTLSDGVQAPQAAANYQSGALKQQAAGRIRNEVAARASSAALPFGVRAPDSTAPMPYSAPGRMGDRRNPITEENLRMMWDASGGNEAQFNATVAKYGIDGALWLNDQKNSPGQKFKIATETKTTPIMPYTMLGPDRAGGTRPPGAVADQRGQYLGGLSYTESKLVNNPNNDQVDPKYLLDPTPAGSPAPALYAIRDAGQAPYSASDTARARGMEADRLEVAGAVQQGQADPTGQFTYGPQFAEAALDRSAAEGEAIRAEGRGAEVAAGDTVALRRENQQLRQQLQRAANGAGRGVTASVRPADRVNFYKSLSTTRVPDGKGSLRRMTEEEKTETVNKFFGGGSGDEGGDAALEVRTNGSQAKRAPTTQPSTFTENGAVPIDAQNAAASTKPTKSQAIRAIERANGDRNKAMAALEAVGFDVSGGYAD